MTRTAKEGEEMLRKLLNDAQLNRCQMIEVNLSSSEVVVFDADPRSFASVVVEETPRPSPPPSNSSQQKAGNPNSKQVKCNECGTLKGSDAFSKQQLKRPKTARCISCIDAANKPPLMMDLPGCAPWTPELRQEAEAKFKGLPVSPDMDRDSEAVAYQKMIPHFYKEFMSVINCFAAAKFKAEGKGALFLFSRSPPSDLLCIDYTKCRHEDARRRNLCPHGPPPLPHHYHPLPPPLAPPPPAWLLLP
eukprot:2487200-Rhodomonas_salina.1